MKTLLTLILILSFTCTNAFALREEKMSKDQKKMAKKIDDLIADIFKSQWGKGDEKKHGCEKNKHKIGSPDNPSSMDMAIFDLLDNLYTQGYFYKPEEIETWKSKYYGVKGTKRYRRLHVNKRDDDLDYHDGSHTYNGCKRKGRWKRLYKKDFGKDLRKFFKNRDWKIQCADLGTNDMATTRPCCQYEEDANYFQRVIFQNANTNAHPLPFIGFNVDEHAPDKKGLAKPGGKCQKHTDCISGQCMQFAGDEEGTCAPILKCYTRLAKDAECHPRINPYCKSSWKGNSGKKYELLCDPTNHESTGIGECKQLGQTCSTDTQCCSDKCGENGTCDFKGVCRACVGMNEVVDGDAQDDGIECCPGLYKGMPDEDTGLSKCIPKFPPLVLPQQSSFESKGERSILQKVLDFIIPSAHASNSQSCNYFTEDQRRQLNDLTEECFTENESGTANLETNVNACLEAVTMKKEEFRTENYNEAQTELDSKLAECNEMSGEEKQQCVTNASDWFGEKCDSGSHLTREEYAGTYNIPQIRSKTTSNPKTCQFNMMNDMWAASSPDEKNAELVVRAFEYLFSGGGAQDFWVQNADSKNIFKRSKGIAQRLKNRRKELINKLKAKDIEMMCSCVLATKGEGVPSEVMQTFNVIPECEDEKDTLAKILSIENDQYAAGATGISHEKLLLDFTRVKMETSYDEFDKYADINEEIESLTKYISGEGEDGVDWHAAQLESKKIYTFKVKWMSTWLKIVIVVVAVAVIAFLIVITAGAAGAGVGIVSALVQGGSAIAGGLGVGFTATAASVLSAIGVTALSAGAVAGGLMAIFSNKIAKPDIRDVIIQAKNIEKAYDEDKEKYKWHQGKKWNWLATHRFFEIERWYDYPYHSDPNSGCTIYAPASMCIKNMFLTVHNESLRYMTDIKKPLFVNQSAWPDDIGYVQNVNAAHMYLIEQLKDTYPGPVTKRKFLQDNVLARPKIKAAMMPLNGTFYPDVFDEPKTKSVIAAVKKFATCKELNGPDAVDECKIEPNEDLGVEEGDIGFGYFFESEEDVNDFASYFFQHHFHWPSITANTRVGYPLLGQTVYYQNLLHNIRIVMANLANLAVLNGNAFDMYSSDWATRSGEYDCSENGEDAGSTICAVITEGNKSANSKYSSKFRGAFKQINFQLGEVPGQFGGANSEIPESLSSGLSDGEAKILGSAKANAFANKDQLKKAAYYNENVAKTPRGKQVQKAFDNWNKDFNSPMQKMDMQKAGRSWGGVSSSTTTVTNNYNKDNDDKGKVANYKPYEADFGSSYSPSYSGSKRSSGGSDKVPKTGLSDDRINNDYLLDNANSQLQNFKRDDSDSLFQIVSKAYVRNLSLVLERNSKRKKAPKAGDYVEEKKVDKTKVNELKDLLDE